jgi:hypothetical protein
LRRVRGGGGRIGGYRGEIGKGKDREAGVEGRGGRGHELRIEVGAGVEGRRWSRSGGERCEGCV